MGLSKRLLIVMFVNLAFLVLINIMTHIGMNSLQSGKKNIVDASNAQLSIMTADMMHDALRSDVYGALLASDEEVDLKRGKSEILEDLKEHISVFEAKMSDLGAMELSDSISEKRNAVLEPLQNYIAISKKLVEQSFLDRAATFELVPEFDKLFGELETSMEHLSETLESFQVEALKNTEEQGKSIVLTETIILLSGIVVLIVSMFSLRKKMNSEFSAAFEKLVSGANSLKTSAEQVSSSSQSLAQGATEQAASLEETAAALEEVSSMSKSNADSAHQADLLADGMMTIADKGCSSMDQMSKAIQDIQSSAAETENIISIIENIAFQTNLLALNAAVEAARAGDAGKGFAVVAEEVRNLAKRSADAAKETADKIKRSKDLAENGVSVSKDVSVALSEVMDNAQKTSALVKEIAAASKEQSIGVSQVNSAVTELDKVTQSNAAVAEQSAAASDELRVQGRGIEGVISEMHQVIFGRKSALREASIDEAVSSAQSVNQNKRKIPTASSSYQPKNGAMKSTAASIIPLDDQDYSDF